MSKHALMVGLCLGAAVCVAAADEAKKEGDREELKKFEGTWLMASGEQDGKALAADVVKAARLFIQGDRHTVKVGKETMVGTHKLNPSKSPKQIDVADTEGPYKDKKLQGIYELREDTFRVCFAPPGKERPKEFSTKSGTGTMMHVWKRQKKE